MKSFFEENGGTYTRVGDFLIPDLVMDEQPEGQIGNARWSGIGQRAVKCPCKHRLFVPKGCLLGLSP